METIEGKTLKKGGSLVALLFKVGLLVLLISLLLLFLYYKFNFFVFLK